MRIECAVNGAPRVADGVWAGASLLSLLRDDLGLAGSKNACEQGECGSCSVYLDGRLVCACLVLAGQAEGRDHAEQDQIDGESPGGIHASSPCVRQHRGRQVAKT